MTGVGKASMKENKAATFSMPTAAQIEAELGRVRYAKRFRRALRNTVLTFVIIALVCAGTAYFVMPVLRVQSGTMETSVQSGDVLAALRFVHIDRGDLIAFFHEDKTLVRRVAALEGDTVEIDENGALFVNGELTAPGTQTESVQYTVENGCVFVLADSVDAVDSRNAEMGCVAMDDVIGKVYACIWPPERIGMLTEIFGEE